MVSTVMKLDTFACVKKLEVAGVPPQQAEAHVGLISKIFHDVVPAEQVIYETESKLEIKLKELELKIEQIKGALNTQIAKWVLSTATAQTTIIICFMRFIH